MKNRKWQLMKLKRHVFSFFKTYNKRSSEDTVNQETWNHAYVKASLSSSMSVSVFFRLGRRIQTSPLLCHCILNDFSKQQSPHRIQNTKHFFFLFSWQDKFYVTMLLFQRQWNQTLGKLGYGCITLQNSLFLQISTFPFIHFG